MDEKKFNEIVQALQVHKGVESAFTLTPDGAILFKWGSYALMDDEAKKILQAWKSKEAAVMYMNSRFAILKNDELQLASKNIAQGKGNVVGSKTRDGNYLIAHTRDEGLILLEWSIHVNKVAWL